MEQAQGLFSRARRPGATGFWQTSANSCVLLAQLPREGNPIIFSRAGHERGGRVRGDIVRKSETSAANFTGSILVPFCVARRQSERIRASYRAKAVVRGSGVHPDRNMRVGGARAGNRRIKMRIRLVRGNGRENEKQNGRARLNSSSSRRKNRGIEVAANYGLNFSARRFQANVA